MSFRAWYVQYLTRMLFSASKSFLEGFKRNVKWAAPRLLHFLVAKQPWELADGPGWRGVLNRAC